MRAGVFLVALMACSAVQAQVYKCDQGGAVVFSDRPCEGGKGKTIDVRPAAGAGGAVEVTEATEKGRALLDQYERERAVRRINYDIDALEATMQADQRRMDAELAALREKKRYALNNLAGATWESSISQEMQAIAERYRAKSEADQRRLESLRARLAGIRD